MILLLFAFVLAAASPLYPQAPATIGKANLRSSTEAAKNLAQQAAGGMANAGPQKAAVRHPAPAHHGWGVRQNRPHHLSGCRQSRRSYELASHGRHTRKSVCMLEAKGPGVCLLDYDNDGWLDIYLVNGSTYDALTGKATPPHAALFHNNHDGTFTDVTEKAGVANDRWGYGCAVGDYDNDGWPDLYVTNYGKNRLYHNNHDGTFTDVAEKAGVTVGTWSTGATFGDYDGDGRLDLFVDGYVQIDLNNPPLYGTKGDRQCACASIAACQVMCGPRGLAGRARPSIPQQWRRHLYRREQEAGRRRSQWLLRAWRFIRRRQQRRQARPARGQRLDAELPLHEQGRWHVRRSTVTTAATPSMAMAARSPTWGLRPATTRTTAIFRS